MTTSTDQGLRGLALLDAAIEHIERYPDTWEQMDYRCGSGMCVAGWACEIAGGRWAAPADGEEWSDYLVAEDGDSRIDISENPDIGPVIMAGDRAERLLGISFDDRMRLFAGRNTLDDIRRIRNNLAAGGLS